MTEQERQAKITELNIELKKIKNSCEKVYGTGTDGEACKHYRGYYQVKKELNELLLADD